MPSIFDQTPQAIAVQIADQLGETEASPRHLVTLITELGGIEFAQALLKETLSIEANGGLLTHDKKRRRTMGGVFLFLARERMAPEVCKQIFPGWQPPRKWTKKKAKSKNPKQAAPTPPPPQITSEELYTLVETVLQAQGDATTVKVTLIGRPGQVEQRGQLIVTAMQHDGKFPSLPKGLPEPPGTPTSYVVYIAAKQWNKVAEAIANPEDKLIVDGQLSFDPKLGQIVVYTTNVTTKLLDQAKRAEMKGEAPAQAQPQKAETLAQSQSAQNKPEAPIVDNTAILIELREAERIAAEKLAAIHALPASQRTGLMSAMKELTAIRTQIKLLEG